MADVLFHPEESLVVLGSLNAKMEDRELQRSEISPLQIISNGEVRPIPFFDSWGELGLSSMTWHPDRPKIIYFSSGKDLIKVDLVKQDIVPFVIDGLMDIHEMTRVDTTLWIANTGHDEAIAFDMASEKVIERIRLAKMHLSGIEIDHRKPSQNDELKVADKFHSNQVIDGFGEELFVLVHHVTGKQLVKRIAQKLLKEHGNGGIVDLRSGAAFSLKLKGPHSIRKIRDEYWLMDSGNATINIYTPQWTLKEKIATKGWGRGAAISHSLGLFYAGISATRKRYMGLIGKKRHERSLQYGSGVLNRKRLRWTTSNRSRDRTD